METWKTYLLAPMLVAIVLLALSASCSYAQDEPNPVNFAYSYATFLGDDGSSILEISYSFAENGLTYVNGKAQLLLTLSFYDKNWVYLDSYTTTVSHSTENPAPVALAGIERFALNPGLYGMGMKLVDGNNPTRTDSTGFSVRVRPFKKNALCISDLELIKEIAPASDDKQSHPLVRNGYTIVRNISGIITAPDFRVNSYLEIYNSHRLEHSHFAVAYLIADTAGRGLYRRDTTLPKGVTRTVFDLNSARINGLSSGAYILAARVYNGPRDVATDSIEVTRTFQVYNPKQDSVYAARGIEPANYTDVIDPLYAGLKEEEIDKEYQKAAFIIAESRKEVWKGLSGPESKARFLTLFWQYLDDDPSTPENPFRDDYYERIKKAKDMYASPLHPEGWNSDRGRILLQHGNPDAIERHPFDPNRKPYEIWRYSSFGYYFVFVDRTQTGNYQLVHSTAPNEIRAPDWEGNDAALHKQMRDGEFGTQRRSIYDN